MLVGLLNKKFQKDEYVGEQCLDSRGEFLREEYVCSWTGGFGFALK